MPRPADADDEDERSARDAIRTRLGDALDAKGWDQRKLAVELGVSDAAVSKWLGGGSLANWRRLAAVCEALGKSADEILGLVAPAADQAPGRPAVLELAERLQEAQEVLAPYLRAEDIKTLRERSKRARAKVPRAKGKIRQGSA